MLAPPPPSQYLPSSSSSQLSSSPSSLFLNRNNHALIQYTPLSQNSALMPRSYRVPSSCPHCHPRFTLSGELRNSWYRYPPPTPTLAHPPLLSTPHPPLGPLGPKGPQVSQGVGGGRDRRGGVGVGGGGTRTMYFSAPQLRVNCLTISLTTCCCERKG